MREVGKIIDIGIQKVRIVGDENDYYYQNLQSFVNNHPQLLHYARSNLRSDYVCFDVGASIGITTLLLCSLCPNGHVYSFEPSPVNAGYLRQNLAFNGVKNCTIIEAGVGERAGSLQFHHSSFSGAESHFVTEAHLDRENKQTIPVDVVTLDDFLNRKREVGRLDFIKIDAEGFEPAILAGARDTIKRFKPIIFMEFNSWALYFCHRFDPYTFASALWDTFDVLTADEHGELSPAANGDLHSFFCKNMTAHGCVDDVVLRVRDGKVVPHFAEMVGPTAQLVEQIRELEQSTSWRITAPLRAIKSAFSRKQ